MIPPMGFAYFSPSFFYILGKDDNDVIYINVKLSMLLLGNGPPAGLLV